MSKHKLASDSGLAPPPPHFLKYKGVMVLLSKPNTFSPQSDVILLSVKLLHIKHP